LSFFLNVSRVRDVKMQINVKKAGWAADFLLMSN